MQYRMKTWAEDGKIFIEEGWENPAEPLLERFKTMVFDTREKVTSDALKALGWLSPEEAQALYLELEAAEDELRVYGERDDG